MNPFTALGLPIRPDLTDEQVRAAWRTIAAATHPDRPDGGDVTRYTAAATAYAQLRTAWGRGGGLRRLATDQPYVPAPAAQLPRAPASALSARRCWSRPASGTAARCGCWPAPSSLLCCRCWSCAWCRGSPPGPPW